MFYCTSLPQALLTLSANTLVPMGSRYCTWETIYLVMSSKPRRSRHGGGCCSQKFHSCDICIVVFRTFLVIPELSDEVSIWESNQCECNHYPNVTR